MLRNYQTPPISVQAVLDTFRAACWEKFNLDVICILTPTSQHLWSP